ncbi:hypothetical protein AV530_008261 [Patagioenas fasciata monilis]|uniref:Uncharacterized protein n=1 Tax=Patagioenas fasciata monilis TaxID=372326 RepID=A0A1V4KV46_PATFA|nr:hypothetical protein AV530_008261 [Patagioenas fasciata monilis]
MSLLLRYSVATCPKSHQYSLVNIAQGPALPWSFRLCLPLGCPATPGEAAPCEEWDTLSPRFLPVSLRKTAPAVECENKVKKDSKGLLKC